LLAKRTFREKVTILHAEYHRAGDKDLPGRYSRHYYDVAMMTQGPVSVDALADRTTAGSGGSPQTGVLSGGVGTL
jgi:hypothetical protein